VSIRESFLSLKTHLVKMPALQVGEDVRSAYDDVRSDATPTNWAALKYDASGNRISVAGTGSDGLHGLANEFAEGERAYGFLRVTSGDELSARAKFVFITWVSEKVSPLKKARVSTDKAFVKEVVKDFALELHATSPADLHEDDILRQVKKASGADYSTNS